MFIGGGGGCTGAGGGTGIDGPDDCWNDCELQEDTTHAIRIASAATTADEVIERWLIIGRGIDFSCGRMVEYRLRRAAEQQNDGVFPAVVRMFVRWDQGDPAFCLHSRRWYL
jgi:hypothetical protein